MNANLGLLTSMTKEEGIYLVILHSIGVFTNFKTPLFMKNNGFYNCTVSKANVDSSKNMLLLKNSQFLPNHYETLPK